MLQLSPKPDRFEIYPVVWANGQCSVPIASLVAVWEALEASGRGREVFYDGGVTTAAEWVVFLAQPQVLPLLVWDHEEQRVVCVAWLGDLKRGSASVHHVWLSAFRRDVARQVLAYWDTFQDESGSPLFWVYIGVTPEPYRLALRAAHLMGFERVGRVPNLCHIVYWQRRVAGIITQRQHGG